MSTKHPPHAYGHHARRQRYARQHRILRSARLCPKISCNRRGRRLLRDRRHRVRAFPGINSPPMPRCRISHGRKPFADRRWPGIAAPSRRSMRCWISQSPGRLAVQAGAQDRLRRLFRLFLRSRRPSLGSRGCARHRSRRRPAGSPAGLERDALACRFSLPANCLLRRDGPEARASIGKAAARHLDDAAPDSARRGRRGYIDPA